MPRLNGGRNPATLTERVRARLLTGATIDSIARLEGISPALAEIMVDELKRLGLVTAADTLCASGLGACHGGDSPEVRIHCSGCPLIPLRTSKP